MGLTVAIGNALSGLKASQTALEVISRNISNAGTPGYHKQTLNVIEVGRGDNSYVRAGQVDRAFDTILQNYYTKQVPETAYSATRGTFLDRLQTALGKPGGAGSLDTMLGHLQNALDALATSPDNYAARADVVTKAGDMASTLNKLSQEVQSMRRETETRMASSVDQINSMLTSLRDVNLVLADYGVDQNTRNSLLDQRDRLVSGLSEMMDLRVDYNPDGTVRLATRSGASILDVRPSLLQFEQAGSLTPTSEFNIDDSQSGVGKLILETPNGTRIDLVKDGAIRSGTLGALIELRDTTLQDAQRQLDDIAAALAQVFSTVQRPGTVTGTGATVGAEDRAAMQPGNDMVIEYTDAAGIARQLRLVNVASPATSPRNYVDSNGARTVEVSASGDIGTLLDNLTAAGVSDLTFGKNAKGGLTIAGAGGAAVTKVTSRTTADTTATKTWPSTISANALGSVSAGALASAKPGDHISLEYEVAGTPLKLTLVNSSTPSTAPATGAPDELIVRVDMSAGAAGVKAQLGALTPPLAHLTFDSDASGNLTCATTAPNSLTSLSTTTTNESAYGLNLFVEANGEAFTNSLAGKGQRLGFAGRITINPEVVADNKLLVNWSGSAASGDSKRAEYLVDQFSSLRFGSNSTAGAKNGGFRMAGTLTDMVSQMVEFQGSSIQTALAADETNRGTLDAITSRMEANYGVDINEEVARLMELQNAYAANARVASVVQELLDTLMQSFR
ncbi:flagellar hook-associated protein FlgK [Devosia sp. SD17-2]|uniref:flagellar hook-associated protein FlgK n=1 Tax=Devosia sp. SD17-2 TaxID=2976459 RepID=UPI0023D8B2A7|nr:flagellar hook-associated protein FlgK [Devosia sp. SD17-2]WEJ34819.1 flagellar hook-associated protein FlgK [Devosia sp. SD17-2]